MNYHQIFYNDVLNGEGVRTTLFVSGCEHHCKGCYNQSTWSPDSGKPFTYEVAADILESLEDDKISGLSISGGDPLYEPNLVSISHLVSQVRRRFGDSKTIWMWTGYTLDDIYKDASGNKRFIVDKIDVLIDGKFEQDKADPSLPWRGSSNQKIHRLTS